MQNNTQSLDQFENFDFRELPIGVYMTSLDGQFLECNTMLRKMLDLPLKGPVNANIENYYANPAERESAIERAGKIAEQGKTIDMGILHLRVHNNDVFVEDYSKILQNEEGHVIGFVGCMVDITSDFESKRHERELQERVEELTFDIGRILHANTTTLVMVIQSLNSVVDVLPNPFSGHVTPSIQDIENELTEHANRLVDAIDRFAKVGDENQRLRALPKDKWDILYEQIEALKNYKQRIPAIESYPVALRFAAHSIGQICQIVAPGHLPKEPTRKLQQTAWHLESLATLIDVLKTRTAVMQMDYTLQSLREYITSDMREPIKERRALVTVDELIEQTIGRLAGYAQSSRVDIKTYDIQKVKVSVNEREILRALSNLLHNAIKYTWRRDQIKNPWVSIRTVCVENKVLIEFENWGVPISSEEIEQGLIFKLGYRGKWSTDRGRLGTGIGLTDSLRIAQMHGGNIQIESFPSRDANILQDDYFKQPFLTTVTLSLPL